MEAYEPSSHEIRPGRFWYAAAALILLSGAATTGVLVFRTVTTFTDGMTQMLAPGSEMLELEEPGKYVIYHEHRSVFGGRTYSAQKVPKGLACSVSSERTGEALEVRGATSNTTYSFGSREGVSLFEFSIVSPGTYELVATRDGDASPVILAVGRDSFARLMITIFAAVGICMASFFLGIGMGVLVYVKRQNHRRELIARRAA